MKLIPYRLTALLLTLCMGLAGGQDIGLLPAMTGAGADKDADTVLVRKASAAHPQARQMTLQELANVPGLFEQKLTSGPVRSSGGVSTIADGALTIAKTLGLQSALDLKAPLGAVGAYTIPTGLVSDGATDNAPQIQAALNTGNPVFIPAGNYRIAAALRIKKLGQRLEGAGVQLTVLRVTTPGHNAIQLEEVGGQDVRDVQINYMSVLGPGYSVASPGQTGIFMNDPAKLTTQISAYNSMNHVHIGGFDIGLYAHQNPGIAMRDSMICGNNVAVDFAHVDHWLFENCNIHSWGTMGGAFYNNPGGLLLRIRGAEAGAGNTGHGLSGMFLLGELTRCKRAVEMNGGNMVMIGGNMEGACAGTLDGGLTYSAIGDESFYLEGSARLVLDNVRMSAWTAADLTPNGTTIKWAKRAKIRMDVSKGGVPSVQVRGGWKHEVPLDWDDIAIVGANLGDGRVENFTGSKVMVSRYGTINGTLHSKAPAILDWSKPKEYQDSVANTPVALASREGDISWFTAPEGYGFAFRARLMANLRAPNGDIRRYDLVTAHTLDVLATSETSRGNTGATMTSYPLLDPLPKYQINASGARPGERLIIEASGRFAANASNKKIAFMRNGTSFWESAAIAANDKGWTARAVISSIGAGNYSRATVEIRYDDKVIVDMIPSVEINWSLTNNSVGIGLTGATTGDVTMHSSRLVFESSDKKE